MFFFNRNKIRTRFAPSPTGYLHIGGLRTALYGYLFARQNRGKFVLRIEDTDQTREVAGAVENLLKSLKWAGLEPDEGVLLNRRGKIAEKGRFGPYTQSKRVKIYQKYAQKLVKMGQAYYCFCRTERLEALRQIQEKEGKPTRYDWHCRHLTNNEIKFKLEKSESSVIRLKVPENQEIEFTDWVRGRVKFDTNEIDDQILLKSDGFPTYHLANVIDDHLMKISHIIRGEEWLSSAPKHILLYAMFGWPAPEFIHLPLILNPDRSKLSKRQGDVAVEDYIKQGYLPQAIINFVALLGWNPGTEQETFFLEELIDVFDLSRVHKAGAIFNQEKLDWLNGEYIKKLPLERFVELAMPFLELFPLIKREGNLKKILALEQPRIKKLSEVGEGVKFFFEEELNYEPELLIWKKSPPKANSLPKDRKPTILKNLELLIVELEKYSKGEWIKETLETSIKNFIVSNNLNNGEVLWPMRVALTGLEKSPTPFEVAEILGQEKTISRLKAAVSLLK